MSVQSNHSFERSPFFAWVCRAVISRPALSLLILLFLTGGAAWSAYTLSSVNNTVEAFTPQGSEELANLKIYRSHFEREDAFVVLAKGDVFSMEFLQRLQALHHDLEAVDMPLERPRPEGEAGSPDPSFFDSDDDGWGSEEGGSLVSHVTSLINVRQTESVNDGIVVRGLMEPMPTENTLDALRSKVLGDPFLVGQVVGKEGRHTVLLLHIVDIHDNDMLNLTHVFGGILKAHQAPGFDLQLTGSPAISAQLNGIVERDMSVLGLWSGVLIVLALCYLFRSKVGVIGPTLVVLVSLIWTLGTMALVGLELNILTSIIPGFVLCVGVGDSIHFLSVYGDFRRNGSDIRTAIIDAGSVTGPPILFTSLTTMVGLLSLGLASVDAIAQLGVAGAVGVAAAFCLSLTLLPLVLLLDAGASHTKRDTILEGFIAWLLSLSDPRLGPHRLISVLGFGAGAFLLSLYFSMGLTVSHDDLATVPDDAEVEVAVRTMDEHVGGVGSAQLLITPRTENGIRNLEVLRGLEALAAHGKAYRDPRTGAPVVTHAISVTDVVKETRRAFLGGDQSQYALPRTQEESNNLLFLFENQSPAELRRLATLDLSMTHLTFRVKWIDATEYEPLLRHLDQGIEQHLTPFAEVRKTGFAYLSYQIVRTLLDDLILSFGTAFILVSILMLVLLRSAKLAAIAMVPNLLPIFVVLGYMGATGIPVDLNNLLIASIALGIAVDDTVHFLHHFKTALSKTGDCERAIQAAAHHAGKAMLSTSILLGAGFLVFSQALNVAIQRFGILTAMVVFLAFLIDLSILPAILRRCFGRTGNISVSAT